MSEQNSKMDVEEPALAKGQEKDLARPKTPDLEDRIHDTEEEMKDDTNMFSEAKMEGMEEGEHMTL